MNAPSPAENHPFNCFGIGASWKNHFSPVSSLEMMSHNTDVADSWEREGEDPEFFYQFSPRGYALGVDVLLHVMTH